MAAALAASPACAAGATVPAESTVANISRAYPLSLALDDNSELRWRVDHSETPGDNTATIHMLMELRRSAWCVCPCHLAHSCSSLCESPHVLVVLTF